MLVVGVAVIPAAFGLKCYFCLADKPGTTRLGLEGGASVRAMQSRTFSFKKCRDLKKGDDGYDCDLLKNAEDYKDVKEWVCVYFSPRGRGASGCLPKESKTSGCITAGTEKGCFCNTDLCNFDEEGGNGNVDKDKNKKNKDNPDESYNKATSILGPSSGLWIFLGVFYLVCQLFFFGDGSLALF